MLMNSSPTAGLLATVLTPRLLGLLVLLTPLLRLVDKLRAINPRVRPLTTVLAQGTLLLSGSSRPDPTAWGSDLQLPGIICFPRILRPDVCDGQSPEPAGIRVDLDK